LADQRIHRQALSCLLLGYVGPHPPAWLLDALDSGVGGVVLFGSNVGDGDDVRATTDLLRKAAGRDITVALDEEGGDVTRLDTRRGSAYPGAGALGHLDDTQTTAEVYAAIGTRLADAGVTVNLAPVADVNVDPLNPVIGLRSFGADPDVVARQVAAAVRGVQRSGIAACVKHFPGHGATRSDSHHEVARLDRSSAELETVELVPFRSAISAGVRAVMTGHLVATALDERNLATVSHAITTTTLRDRLGFKGTVVTDALEMKAVSATIGMVEGFVQALIAGADTIETGALDYPELVEAIPRAVENAIRDGRLTEARLHEAATSAAGLAQPGRATPFDRTLVDGAARRCLEVIGTWPELHDPVVIECHPPGGMAGGELPWSFAAALGVSAQVVTQGSPPPDALVGGEPGRTLVVVIRDPMRYAWQLPWIERARSTPGAVLIDVGWPYEPLDRLPVIRTRGIAPGLVAAAADVLTRSGGRR
jgi:beta-N-acetylhexosaminidase